MELSSREAGFPGIRFHFVNETFQRRIFCAHQSQKCRNSIYSYCPNRRLGLPLLFFRPSGSQISEPTAQPTALPSWFTKPKGVRHNHRDQSHPTTVIPNLLIPDLCELPSIRG